MNKPLTHRARNRLLAYTDMARPVWDQAMQWHTERHSEWPNWCYLPMSGWAAATDVLLPPSRSLLTMDEASIAVLGTWRMTQGIYRIDPDVYAALLDTPLEGDIPADVLLRLPQWCIYVETPGTVLADEPVHGFWAMLSHVADSQPPILHVTLDADGPLLTHTLMLGAGTLDQSLSAMLDTAQAHSPLMHVAQQGPHFGRVLELYKSTMRRVLPLLLYLCTPEAMPQGPANPVLQKTKRGPRLFPASSPSVWDVGVRMGAALRAAYAAEPMTTGNPGHAVRGHVRRAHWHGFRSGPMKTPDGQTIPNEKRRFDLRWLPPIAVNLPDIDQLPATIHRVS